MREDALIAIENRESKYQDLLFFEGVLQCMWSHLAIEQGSCPLRATVHAVNYRWLRVGSR